MSLNPGQGTYPNPNFPNNPGYNLYVGARYIPIWDGDWDATKKYEPLTVVQYQGASYTSKTYVPVGVEPTNETYWALSANYNVQFEQLKEEVERYDARITENAEGVAANASQIEANKTDVDAKIAAINTKDTEQDNEISSLNNSVNSLTTLNNKITVYARGKTAIVIGDETLITTNWGNKLGSYQGWNVTQLAKSGAGFTNGVFLDLIRNYISEHQDIVNNVSKIVVGGGFYDANNFSLIDSSAASFKSFINSTFPNAKVYSAFLGKPFWQNYQKIESHLAWSNFKTAWHYWNHERGWDWINLPNVTFALHNNSFYADNGYTILESAGDTIAMAFSRAINGIPIYQNRPFSFTVPESNLVTNENQSNSEGRFNILNYMVRFKGTLNQNIVVDWINLPGPMNELRGSFVQACRFLVSGYNNMLGGFMGYSFQDTGSITFTPVLIDTSITNVQFTDMTPLRIVIPTFTFDI